MIKVKYFVRTGHKYMILLHIFATDIPPPLFLIFFNTLALSFLILVILLVEEVRLITPATPHMKTVIS